ncbi:MAG: FecR domain-containing protein [Gammaproteobacteria bacterium]|nr:FecR domain-containing protein [Gammaproteobacteria bacterium]
MSAHRLSWLPPVGLVALGTLSAPAAWAQCAGATLAPGAAAAQIVALAGQGQTRAPGVEPWSSAALAQQLGAGADMRTLALSSAALLLADRTQIRMSANAQLRLCESQPTRTLLELAAGRLWARTKKTPATLQLQTPAALAVVRGTDWDVEVDAAGRTTLTVLSGLVELSNAQGSVQLGPAEQGFVEPGRAPVKRVLVNPRERVQWVAAYPGDATRWAEFQRTDIAAPLAEVRADLRSGNWGEAQTRLQALSGGTDAPAVVDLALADLEVFAGQLEAGQARLARAWQRTQDPRTAARRAELLLALDRAAEARAWIDSSRAVAPTSVDLLLADADAHRLEGQGDAALALYRQAVDRAETEAQQAAALDPATARLAAAPDPATARLAAALWGLGRALQERGDLYTARATLARAVQLAPDHPGYRAEQATADTEAMRLTEARAGFDAALALAGDDYTSLAGAGLLALQRGDAETARKELLKALVIEPRYARAQVWLAVAEYQLGERAAALDSLDRARLADPNDPLPWQIESILRNDSGEPEAAIAAARQALVRLPYLKSLNPLVSDSQGSANLGKALGDFGLEHWARAYAQQSYYPLWAGSHFFMANRYESSFSRSSELYQGYLADPLAFGASEKQAPLLRTTGSEWLAGAGAQRGPVHDAGVFDVGHRGLASAPMPIAWRVGIEGQQQDPRDGTGSYRLLSSGMRLGVGIKPTDRLSLLLLHFEDRTRYSVPGGLVDIDGVVFNTQARSPTRRTDVGGAWRWSADEQTWFKVGRASYGDRKALQQDPVGTYDERSADTADSLMLRHTVQHGAQRWSAGWERSRVRLGFQRAYSLVTSTEHSDLRFDMPWLALESTHGPWTWHAQASWPHFDMRYRSRVFAGATGDDLRAPLLDEGGHPRRLLPRLGVSYRFGPGRALHAAYIESLHAPAANTLAPVSVGAIPIDHQYQMPGSLVRKSAVQLDWEFNARTFGYASLSQQTIANAMYSDGSLLYMPNVLVGERVESLGPLIQTAETAVDAYNGTPLFDRGQLRQAGVALNRILTPRWSLLAGYTWAQTRNTGDWVPGNALPGFPRHTLVLVNVWKHGGRDYTYGSLVYRSARFTTALNGRSEAPGWSLALAHSMDFADRRWSLIGSVQTPLDGREKPTLWLRVRFRE